MSMHLFRSALVLTALFTGAATFPSSLAAQRDARDERGSPAVQMSLDSTRAPVDSAHATAAAGPRTAPAGFTTLAAATSAGPARPFEDTQRGDNRNVAMMGVGAAAVGLGLIVGGSGGTIVALTGGVIGLAGLYRYLR